MPLIGAIVAIVAILVSCVLDPKGFINQLICGLIDLISVVFPSTPQSLKLSSIVASLSAFMPVFGVTVINNIVVTVRDLFVLFFAIKIYRLIPFKAT